MLKRILISFGHSVLIILLHLVYFNLNWSIPHEYEMMMGMNKIESFIGGHGKFEENDFFFINTAYDLEIIETENEYGETGKATITNRKTLTKFFDKMAEFGNKHNYILCDILFDLKSESDSMLEKSLNRVNKLLAPALFNKKERKLMNPVIDVNYAQADYITYEGIVSKMRLYAKESKTKTYSLKMFEEYNSLDTDIGALGLTYNMNYIPISIYPRYYYDREKMRKHEMSLGNLVGLLEISDTNFYKEVLEDKILVLGNFLNDMHPTFIGPMPGSLVLLNTYLTLEAGYHLLNWSWFLFAILSISILCYFEIFKSRLSSSKTTSGWKTFLKSLLSVTWWSLLISFLSGIIFMVHITVIPLVIYLEIFKHIEKFKRIQLKGKK